MKRVLGFLALCIFASGCTRGHIVVTGKTFDPIKWDQVKVYSRHPPKYEVVGLISVTSEIGFSTDSAVEAGMKKMKVLAANKGANGIVMGNTNRSGGDTDVAATIITGTPVVESEYVNLSGEAIHVP